MANLVVDFNASLTINYVQFYQGRRPAIILESATFMVYNRCGYNLIIHVILNNPIRKFFVCLFLSRQNRATDRHEFLQFEGPFYPGIISYVTLKKIIKAKPGLAE